MFKFAPIVLILSIIIAPPIVSVTFFSGISAIVFGWIFIFVLSLGLLLMFSSVLFKGLGPHRNVASILLVAVSGIVSLITHFSILYRWTGLHGPPGADTESLFNAFYFSVVTWTTLGYGDFLPAEGARYIVVVEAMLGYLMMALLISVFVTSIGKTRPR